MGEIFGKVYCPGCGCELSDYEVFACKLRGLKRHPVCLGCLIKTAVWLRDEVLPMLNAALGAVEELGERQKLERMGPAKLDRVLFPKKWERRKDGHAI